MFHLVLQRILHKKWMVASLLIGNILLVAIAVSHPMYQDASRRHMLTDGFTNYLSTNNTYPMVIKTTAMVRANSGTGFMTRVRTFADTLCERFEIPQTEHICFRGLVSSEAKVLNMQTHSVFKISLSPSSLSKLSDHVNILSGRMYEDKVTDDGFIEVIISQSTMVNYNLLVGEELEIASIKYPDKSPMRFRIVGVFGISDPEDVYWIDSPDIYEDNLFMNPSLFEELYMGENISSYMIDEKHTVLPDYTALRPEQVEYVLAVSKNISTAPEFKSVYIKMAEPAYIPVLEDFVVKEKQITVTLSILQIPVIVLLCAFIFMISRQMLEMEENEIALLKSRGASKRQVLRLYFYQSGILCLASFIVGLPLGALICKALGASSAFLVFGSRRVLDVEFTGEVFLYGLIALAASMLMTLLPVFKRDKVSIVAVKRKRSRSQKPFWQKFFLDFIILGISIYGFYNFSNQQDELLLRVISGKSLDPLLFISSSLFILGAGMVSLRIHGYVVKLIYRLGKKNWKPANYTSFLQIIRTGNKQAFIMVFLVLTVAFGLFNTTVARTILANAENNSTYISGADLIFREKWKNNASYAANNPDYEIIFVEPDYARFGQIPGVTAMTKVYRNNDTTMKKDGKSVTGTILGIETKNFGLVTDLKPGLLKYDFRDYLNTLSTNTDAILLSANYRDKLGYKVGDKVTYSVNDAFKANITATVYGFFDYWPSYAPTSYSLTDDGSSVAEDNYLMIAHLSTLQEKVGVLPYEVWMNMNGDTSGFYSFYRENELQLEKCVDGVDKKNAIASEPLFQGTNGILTMSFITILLICCIGYVIYWMLSIRSRELLFGIFRAMGMSRNEIIHMLVNEQMFTGAFGIIFGLLIGWLASKMFVPIIQIAYSASDRVLPLELITKSSDVARLIIIIAIMFIICLGILINQVFRMKISQALKLGED